MLMPLSPKFGEGLGFRDKAGRAQGLSVLRLHSLPSSRDHMWYRGSNRGQMYIKQVLSLLDYGSGYVQDILL